jgi:hypothetical protein
MTSRPQSTLKRPSPGRSSFPDGDAITVLLPEDGPVLTSRLARALVRLIRNTAERELSTTSLPPAA